jgi:hypothetical protein
MAGPRGQDVETTVTPSKNVIAAVVGPSEVRKAIDMIVQAKATPTLRT